MLLFITILAEIFNKQYEGKTDRESQVCIHTTHNSTKNTALEQ